MARRPCFKINVCNSGSSGFWKKRTKSQRAWDGGNIHILINQKNRAVTLPLTFFFQIFYQPELVSYFYHQDAQATLEVQSGWARMYNLYKQEKKKCSNQGEKYAVFLSQLPFSFPPPPHCDRGLSIFCNKEKVGKEKGGAVISVALLNWGLQWEEKALHWER